MLQQVLEQAQGLEKVAAVAERGVHEPCCAGPDMRRTAAASTRFALQCAKDVFQRCILGRSQLLICQLLGAVLSRTSGCQLSRALARARDSVVTSICRRALEHTGVALTRFGASRPAPQHLFASDAAVRSRSLETTRARPSLCC